MYYVLINCYFTQSLQECFEKQDIPMLHKFIGEMDEKDARYHMKRCVDSGLWVPDKNSKQPLLEDPAESGET